MEGIPSSITVLKSTFYESKFKCFETQDTLLYPNTTHSIYLECIWVTVRLGNIGKCAL